MLKAIFSGLAAAAFLLLAPASASATVCVADDFAAAVDRSGASLRAFNGEMLPQLQEKLKQLKAQRGWNDADGEERAMALVRDERTAKLDTEAEDLIIKIDTLGRLPEKGLPDCSKLTELEAAGVELMAVMKAKSKYTLAKLDAALAGVGKSVAQGQGASPPPATVAKADQAPPKPVSKSKAQSWSAQTKAEPRPRSSEGKPADTGVPTMEPGPSVAMLEPVPPDEPGYTIDEIREISRGFFGTISTELGSVIEYAFSNAGRPDGYVLGTEGGGAFLAGLRYGTGTLYMRTGGSSKIYWHGPSIGTDVGASGSRTMFLIYRMQQPDDLYRQFTGVDGSAYFIGGAGITFLKGGPVMMAPIRTGLGFRLGANIGYIRFTPRPTWNPF